MSERASFELAENDVDPWDVEDCEACFRRESVPCDFHQGMDFGFWAAAQVAQMALTDDVDPGTWAEVRERAEMTSDD